MFKKAIGTGKIVISKLARQRPDGALARMRPETDGYDVCIKAKAIAQRSGASSAMAYALPRLQARCVQKDGGQAVLLNTILSTFSKEGKQQEFWELFNAKLMGEESNRLWSEALTTTLLNQLANEMQSATGEQVNELQARALSIYKQGIQLNQNKSSCISIHNALLKCLSRAKNLALSLELLNFLLNGKVSEFIPIWKYGLTFGDTFGKIPVAVAADGESSSIAFDGDSVIKKVVATTAKVSPTTIDAQTASTILTTLARSPQGSLSLAEDLLALLKKFIQPDEHVYLNLLLVYRNDLDRILKKLERSQSWRQRKLNRIQEIMTESGVNLKENIKFRSVYYECLLHLGMSEKILEEAQGTTDSKDARMQAILKCASWKSNK